MLALEHTIDNVYPTHTSKHGYSRCARRLGHGLGTGQCELLHRKGIWNLGGAPKGGGCWICHSLRNNERTLVSSHGTQDSSCRRVSRTVFAVNPQCHGWMEEYTVLVSSTAITGWRRLIGCLKLQVISHKRATNYTALLRKMTCKDKASYDSTPPFTAFTFYFWPILSN